LAVSHINWMSCHSIGVMKPNGGDRAVESAGNLGARALLVDGTPAKAPFARVGFRRANGVREYRLRPDIVVIVHDENARLLDLRHAKFYAINGVATRMLLLALERGPEAMVSALSQEYEVDKTQVEADWQSLVKELESARLAKAVRLRTACTRIPGPLTLRISLALAWVSFRVLGWERTLRLWRCGKRRIGVSSLTERQSFVAAVDELVRRHAASHVMNPQCKERALVAWRVLQKLGLSSRLVMGVELYPFEAHAWTQCGDQIVGEDRERCKRFTPVAYYDS
jgi:hypothetical protein